VSSVSTGDNNLACGYRDLTLEVPWTSFSGGGAGGLVRLDHGNPVAGRSSGGHYIRYGNSVSTAVKDSDTTFFQYAGVMEINATFPVTGTSVNTPRELAVDRHEVWRYPFVIKFKSDIVVTTTFNVFAFGDCKFAAAIVSALQTETFFDIPHRSAHAVIRLTLQTKSQYPYRLVAPIWKAYVELDDPTYEVDTNLERVNDEGPYGLVDTEQHSQVCAFKEGVGADIFNTECTQTWQFTITPQWETTCNVNGEYRITLDFGGWGDLPFNIRACFDRDTGISYDSKTFVFNVQSSDFCPRVADQIILAGQLAQSASQWAKSYEDATDPDVIMQPKIYDYPHFVVTAFGGRANTYNSYDLTITELQETVNIIHVQVNNIWVKQRYANFVNKTALLYGALGDALRFHATPEILYGGYYYQLTHISYFEAALTQKIYELTGSISNSIAYLPEGCLENLFTIEALWQERGTFTVPNSISVEKLIETFHEFNTEPCLNWFKNSIIWTLMPELPPLDYFLTEFDIYVRDNPVFQGDITMNFHNRQYVRTVLEADDDVKDSAWFQDFNTDYQQSNVAGFRFKLDPRIFPTDYDGIPTEIITYATVEVVYEGFDGSIRRRLETHEFNPRRHLQQDYAEDEPEGVDVVGTNPVSLKVTWPEGREPDFSDLINYQRPTEIVQSTDASDVETFVGLDPTDDESSASLLSLLAVLLMFCFY